MRPFLFNSICFLVFCAAGFLSRAHAEDVKLKWLANTEAELAGYRIHYKTGRSGPPYDGKEADQGTSPIVLPLEDMADPDNPEFTLTGLKNAETHYFAVSAYANKPIPLNSRYSNEAVYPPDHAAPVIVSPPVVVSKTDVTATIGWETDEPGDSRIQYGQASGTWGSYPFSIEDTPYVVTHRMTISDLEPDTEYRFRVGSADRSGNGPELNPNMSNPSHDEYRFTTDPPPDTDPPSFAGFPTMDFENMTIDVVFDEPDMQNVTLEENFMFSPTLLFRTQGGSDDILSIDARTFRLSLAFIPVDTIVTLTLENITDEAGNPLSPNSIRINDNDNDQMADDWEWAQGLDPNDPSDAIADNDEDELNNLQEFSAGGGTSPHDSDTDHDGMDDGWEVSHGTNPLTNDGDADPDRDDWTNYEEYLSASDPLDASSMPLAILDRIPAFDSGNTAPPPLPVDASIAFLVEASKGLDANNATGVIFFLNDSGITHYSRSLTDSPVTMAIAASASESGLTRYWIAYDRSSEPALKSCYDFDTNVGIGIYLIDMAGNSIFSEEYQFETHSVTAYLAEQSERISTALTHETPSTWIIEAVDSDSTTEASHRGARLVFNGDDGGVTPYFGGTSSIPAVALAGVSIDGTPLNIKPPRIFASGLTVFIPCPDYDDVEGLAVYGFDGTDWALICDGSGIVQSGMEGWLVPSWNNGISKDVLNNGNPSGVTIRAYRSGAYVAGNLPPE